MKDPMSLRLGDLAEPLLKRCEKTGETTNDVLRLALAKELGSEFVGSGIVFVGRIGDK